MQLCESQFIFNIGATYMPMFTKYENITCDIEDAIQMYNLKKSYNKNIENITQISINVLI